MKKFAVLAILAVSAAGFAATLIQATGTATPYGSAGSRETVVYSNLTNNPYGSTSYYFNSLPYAAPQQLGDDLHMTSGGELSSFKFTYFDPNDGSPAVQSVQIYFYDYATFNPNGTSPPIAQYNVTGLPGIKGGWIISVPVSPGVILPADVVMSQLQDTVTSGPYIFDPPTIGSSNDNLWAGPPDGQWFTGQQIGMPPPYNLGFGYEVSLVPEPATMLVLGLAGLLIRRR